MKLRTTFLALVAASLAACGSSTASDGTAAVDSGTTGGSDVTAGADVGSGTDAVGGDGAVVGDATTSGSDAALEVAADVAVSKFSCPKTVYKKLVVIGDSISDVGGSGSGQTPFYRTLLVQNDDTLYPDWQGFDLKTCWGLDPKANVVKVSKGGAVASEGSMASVLFTQTKSIKQTLEGPVLVVGTIGGNDVTSGLVHVIAGTPAQVTADIAAFVKGFGDAMNDLTKPDRFGAGVKVDVLITNIYDPTGGTGDFTYAPAGKSCGGMFTLWPAGQSTEAPLKDWNDAMAAEAANYPGVHLLDLHTQFLGHQVNVPDPENWFHGDCIHPNTAGHEHIRELFWQAMLTL